MTNQPFAGPLPSSCDLIPLLSEDDCAPDARESFEASFPAKALGIAFKDFLQMARREDLDEGSATQWHLGPFLLVISADDPFYSLYLREPPSTTP